MEPCRFRTGLQGHRILLACLAVWAVYGQQDRATITGTVSDPSGSLVPNVTISIQNTETNAAYQTATTSAGQYTMPNLPIGKYRASFEAAGFKRAVRDGIVLNVNQTARLDILLELGSTAESIEVRAEVPLLQTDSPDVGTVLDNRKVLNLPLSFSGGRDNEAFAYRLTPGVQGDSWTSLVNGSPSFSKEVVLDGASVSIYLGGHYGESNVSLEAVEEFKVQTSGLSAEFGRTGGGVFNFVLKSGTNTPHGSAVGLLRNEALNANTFSNNFYGRPRLKDRRYDYAFSFGAPVFIPKVYNGKDKTFFYAAYELFHVENRGFGSPNRTVPTPAWWGGDMSNYLTSQSMGTDALGRNVLRGAIYDPATTRNVGGTVLRDIFPGNIIPQARISQVSKNLGAIMQKYYPPLVKNPDGSDALFSNSFFPLANNPQTEQRQFSIKGDHMVSEKQKISVTFSRTYRPRLLLDSGGVWQMDSTDGGPLSKLREQNVKTYLGRFAHDYTIRPNMLNHFLMGVNRQANPSISVHDGEPGGQILGIKGIEQDSNYPNINWGGGDRVNLAPVGYAMNTIIGGTSWQTGDTLTWIKGRHSVKFGVDYRTNTLNARNTSGPGTFTFSGALTGLPGFNYTGHPFASALLGQVANASVVVDTPVGSQFRSWAWFVQDDFKATNRLTLNLGLRWDYQPQQTEKYDRLHNFCVTCVDPKTIGLPGALEFAGNGAGRTGGRGFFPNQATDFGPRVGLAYKLLDRLVFRAGYGIYYLGRTPNDWSGAPYGMKWGFTASNLVNDPGNNTAAFNWDNGYPGVVKTATLDPSLGQSAWAPVIWDPNGGKNGYVQQWNANLQYELPGQFVLDLGYVGSKTTGFYANQLRQVNQLDTKVLALGSILTRSIDRQSSIPAEAVAMGARYPFQNPGTWMPVSQTLQPYPQIPSWSTVLAYNSPLGFATYNSLQIAMNKRYSHGLSLTSNYTFGKTIDNAYSSMQTWDNGGRPLDYHNLGLEKSVAGSDRTHVVKIGLTYELPVGKSRAFGSDMRGWLDAVIGGWNVSYIGNYFSGVPLGFGGPGIPGWNGAVNRANISGAGGLGISFDGSEFDMSRANTPGTTNHLYLDKARIKSPKAYTLGTSSALISQMRGFATYNEDFGLQKNWSVTERFKLQIRFEALNLFNRHQFWNPDTWPDSVTFGQITGVGDGHRECQLGLRLDF